MSLTYECTFRIRHYECDAYGHVNHANYLRYMQEAAYEASAAAGFDMVGYSARGRLWFIRETKIEYLRPLYYGGEVIVRTWVEDFHRVRSIRAYELRVADTGEMAARGWSDWVYLDPATGSPCTIPQEMVEAFMPDAKERVSLPRRRYPVTPAVPPGAFRVLRSVEWRDLDALQHANNAVFLSYFEESAMQAGKRFDWPVERLQQEKIGILTRRAHIEYRQPAVLGEILEIETWISLVRPASFTRHFVVRRAVDQETLCRAQLEYAWVDLGTGKLKRIPLQFRRDFASHISEVSSE